MKLHIEFLGLPGSGKSSLHREAVRMLRQRGQPAYGLPEAVGACLGRHPSDKLLKGLTGRVVHMLSREAGMRVFSRSKDKFLALSEFLAQNLALGEILFASQRVRSIPKDQERLVVKWMLDLFAAFQFVDDRLTQEEVLVLDEGFCNRVNTLFAYGPADGPDVSPQEIGAYVDRIPRPDLVLRIDTSSEASEARLERRGWTERLDQLSPPERRAVLERSRQCIDLATSRLREAGVSVVPIDNNQALPTAVAAMEEVLSRALGVSTKPTGQE
ncbi:MAG: hypothetical protein ACRDXD_11475 [Acidimicrobiia bacterium]